jgi:hypothetical protein
MFLRERRNVSLLFDTYPLSRIEDGEEGGWTLPGNEDDTQVRFAIVI